MPFTESQLKKLVEDVEREFTSHLAKAEEEAKALTEIPLVKAEDEDKKPEEKKPKEKKAKPEAEAEKPAAEAKPEVSDEKAPAAPEKESAGHDYDDEDMAHLEKMYMSMSEPELKLHHDIIRKCSMAKCGDITPAAPAPVQKAENHSHDEANGGKIEAACEPKGSPGAKSPASKEQGNLKNMEKSEQNAEVELLKSELQSAHSKYDELKKQFDGVQEFLTKLVKKTAAPAPKAIESLEIIAKSEGGSEEQSLTKSEIDAKLLAKSQDPKTTKADRDAINQFYLNGYDIKRISHLLK